MLYPIELGVRILLRRAEKIAIRQSDREKFRSIRLGRLKTYHCESGVRLQGIGRSRRFEYELLDATDCDCSISAPEN